MYRSYPYQERVICAVVQSSRRTDKKLKHTVREYSKPALYVKLKYEAKIYLPSNFLPRIMRAAGRWVRGSCE